MSRTEHWDRVYTAKGDLEVSWFESDPATSLSMLDAAALSTDSCVIDIGGGNSRLADRLVERGLTCITVLDVSAVAIARARARLGEAAGRLRWIVADVTGDWTPPAIDLWHDRAVFHFLTEPADRARYVERLTQAVRPGGSVVIATFAPDGPETCSGLPVVRYSADALAATLGPTFRLEQSLTRTHGTPWGSSQAFQYARFSRPSRGAVSS